MAERFKGVMMIAGIIWWAMLGGAGMIILVGIMGLMERKEGRKEKKIGKF